MTLVKCPRCELNYMHEGDKMCSVCRKEIRGDLESYDVIEMCSECGENPALPGQELCAYCLKEFARRNPSTSDDAVIQDPTIEIDSVSTMDEIDLDIGDEVFEDEDAPFSDEEDEDDVVGKEKQDEEDEDGN